MSHPQGRERAGLWCRSFWKGFPDWLPRAPLRHTMRRSYQDRLRPTFPKRGAGRTGGKSFAIEWQQMDSSAEETAAVFKLAVTRSGPVTTTAPAPVVK